MPRAEHEQREPQARPATKHAPAQNRNATMDAVSMTRNTALSMRRSSGSTGYNSRTRRIASRMLAALSDVLLLRYVMGTSTT